MSVAERRLRGVLPRLSISLQYVEALAAELGSFAGGVEAVALREVAVARRKYPQGPLTARQICDRALQLPLLLATQLKNHALCCAGEAYTGVMRFLALNVIARLYSKSVAEPQR